MAHDDQPRWLEMWEASIYSGFPEGTLRRFARDGVLPITKPGGKPKSRIRIDRHDLDALMAAGYQPATTGPLANKSD
jgi:hypothetical protein